MTVTDQQTATVRALLAGNHSDYQQLSILIDDQQDSLGYSALLTGAFYEAVSRRFTADSTAADVVSYVADVRSRLDEVAQAVDPLDAERLIREALGDGSTQDIPGRASVTAKLFLLAALIADENLDSRELDEFMTKARNNADYLLS